jgi:hypothetical protein
MNKPENTEDIYERLAAALDALPHGFPRTPSGVELRLIKMAFTPEEVSLAGQLTRFPETAAAIAKRVGRDEALLAMKHQVVELSMLWEEQHYCVGELRRSWC